MEYSVLHVLSGVWSMGLDKAPLLKVILNYPVRHNLALRTLRDAFAIWHKNSRIVQRRVLRLPFLGRYSVRE